MRDVFIPYGSLSRNVGEGEERGGEWEGVEKGEEGRSKEKGKG